MNAKEVIDKILAEAKTEADAIRAEAQSKLSDESDRSNAKLDSYKKETDVLAKEQAEETTSRMLAAARMDMKKEHVQAKAGLIDEVFEKAKERVNSLPNEQYQELISSLMIKAVETGDEEVVVGKNETRIDQNIIKSVNRKLGPGFKGNLRLAGDKADIDGGFILRRGKIQINASTEVLMAQAREELVMELADQLFG